MKTRIYQYCVLCGYKHVQSEDDVRREQVFGGSGLEPVPLCATCRSDIARDMREVEGKEARCA